MTPTLDPIPRGIPVRYIYLDEAGWSQTEPVTVVTGVIVHADTQIIPFEDDLRTVLSTVPEQYRDGFIAHAKSIWGDPIYREGWSRAKRRRFMRRIVRIPSLFGGAIAIGVCKRSTPNDASGRWRTDVFHLMQAFGHCLASADYFLRNFCGPSEVATVVADEITVKGAQGGLRRMLRHLQKNTEIVPFKVLNSREGDGEGFNEQRITRVRDTVHFVDKEYSPLLQIADHCAFGVRRFLEGQEFGEELVSEMSTNHAVETLRKIKDGGNAAGVLLYSATPSTLISLPSHVARLSPSFL
jgi:hypothetical protein